MFSVLSGSKQLPSTRPLRSVQANLPVLLVGRQTRGFPDGSSLTRLLPQPMTPGLQQTPWLDLSHGAIFWTHLHLVGHHLKEIQSGTEQIHSHISDTRLILKNNNF